MAKVSREKIVFVVFLLLIVLALSLLLGYFATARTLSSVASYVDDTVGATENYTIIAYAGVIPPSEIEGEREPNGVGVSGGPPSSSTSSSSALASASSPPSSLSPDSPASSAEERGRDGEGLDSAEVLDEVDGNDEPGTLQPERNGYLTSSEEPREPILVSDVRNSYELQGSDVLTLNLSDLSRYREPTVFRLKDHTVGVYSVSAYATRPLLESIKKQLHDQGADFIVCLTPRTAMLADESYADIVIVTTNEIGVNTIGSYIRDTFIVKAPVQGTVGVITISTGNVVFAKVVD